MDKKRLKVRGGERQQEKRASIQGDKVKSELKRSSRA